MEQPECVWVQRVVVTDRKASRRAGVDSWSAEGWRTPVAVRIEDVWVRKRLSSEWMAAYRVVVQQGYPVIAELRIYPFEKDAEAGEWSGILRGIQAIAPQGGLTATVARSATLGADVANGLHEVMDYWERELPELREQLRTLGLQHSEKPEPQKERRGGRLGRPRGWYAKLAQAYADACRRNSKRPLKEAAEAMNIESESVAREALHRARVSLGFLTPTTRGRPGGLLTDAGRLALKSLGSLNLSVPASVPNTEPRRTKTDPTLTKKTRRILSKIG